MEIKNFILNGLKDFQIKSDEQMLNKFLGFTFFWSKSAIVKKGSSFIRKLKKMRQNGEIEEVKSLRIERPIEATKNTLNSAEIFYRVINRKG